MKVGETYQIRETKAREGYNWQILEKEGYKSPHVKEGYEQGNRFFEGIASKVFRCQENQAEIRLEDKECVQVVSLFNRSISGKLEIRKEGEVPEAEIKDQKLQKIVYETKGLRGAEYDLVAAETMPHPDGYSKDLYLMGTTIAHVITDEQGKAVLSDLPLGRYEIRETKAPSGYTRKQKDAKRNTELLWKDSADLEITATETFSTKDRRLISGRNRMARRCLRRCRKSRERSSEKSGKEGPVYLRNVWTERKKTGRKEQNSHFMRKKILRKQTEVLCCRQERR